MNETDEEIEKLYAAWLAIKIVCVTIDFVRRVITNAESSKVDAETSTDVDTRTD